jgi:two-component system OmpR family sensor kinase
VRLTPLEDLFDLLLLVGVAVVVNRLVVRARHAQAVAERAAERERQIREERERVVATVAHDLATPLTVVRGTVQAVQRAGLAQDGDENRLLRRIETAATRASSLVNALTEGDDGGGVRPDRKRQVDVREILRAVTEMMQPVSSRHAIVLHMPDGTIPIAADSERLLRVFENIIGNAIKYSPAGGEISVSLRRQHREATVVIRDHGIGIALEARDRIFDLSYRAPEASTASPGRGLGLHIAAQIVAAHGGTIAAQAAIGGGTAIVVRLPLIDAAEGVAAGVEEPRSATEQPSTS